ncbi:MAG: hypothetical protein ACN2B6_05145 [Rickettsiales bacterium]
MTKPSLEEVHQTALEVFKKKAGNVFVGNDIPDDLNAALLKRTNRNIDGKYADGPEETAVRKVLSNFAREKDCDYAGLLSAYFNYKVSVYKQLGIASNLYNPSMQQLTVSQTRTAHEAGLAAFHAVEIPGLRQNVLPKETEETLKAYAEFSEKNATATGPEVLIERKKTQDSIKEQVVAQLSGQTPEGFIRSAVDRYFEAVNKKIGAELGLSTT